MRKTQKNSLSKRLSAIVLVVVFVLAPLRLDNLLDSIASAATEHNGETISTDTVWEKGEHLVTNVFLTNGATLTIEAGAVVKFSSEGANYGIAGIRIFDGNIVAKGTEREKVIFTANTENDMFGIDLRGSSLGKISFLRYVEFSKGGYVAGMLAENGWQIFQQAQAVSGAEIPVLTYRSGKVHLENCEFKDNPYGDLNAIGYFESGINERDYLEVINSNFSNPNGQPLRLYAECDGELCNEKILLKNNWYGDKWGPNMPELEIFTGGKTLEGNYFLDGYRENPLIADPVLIVPGITGSEMWLGKLRLDPITFTYDDLVSSLRINGFTENVNLFEFPYEWRQSNATSAHYLQANIEGIIRATKVSKVDVVAHSMGGLVARSYIEETDGTQYFDTVDQLITLGTPHQGSPKAYLNWEAGEGFFNLQERLAKYHFQQEAEENGYTDLQAYIQEKITSVKNLLPIYDYLSDAGRAEFRKYPENYPRNTFLEDLNAPRNLEKLQRVRLTSIVGDNSLKDTISSFRLVANSQADGKWPHGMPENFYDQNTDRGLNFGNGDETVPLESAKGIAANKTITVAAAHGDLPTAAQCEILEELTTLTNCKFNKNWYLTNVLLFNVFSPIDIQIVSPSGQRVGSDFAGGQLAEIAGAYYTGSAAKAEFVTIPNPENGEYKILTKGTGVGSFRVQVVKLGENPTDPQAPLESVAEITGTTQVDQMGEENVTVLNNEVITSVADVAAPEITIVSPEAKSYLNNQILPLTYSVTDNQTPKENIQSKIFWDGVEKEFSEIDLALEKLGQHTLKIQALDQAGNLAEKEVVLEITTDIETLYTNLKHYRELGLIKDEKALRFLRHQVAGIWWHLELLEKFQNNSKLKPQVKRKVVQELQKVLSHKIEHLQRDLPKLVRQNRLNQNVAEIIRASLTRLLVK